MEILKSIIQHLINDRSEEASSELHTYMTDKIRVSAGLGQESVKEGKDKPKWYIVWGPWDDGDNEAVKSKTEGLKKIDTESHLHDGVKGKLVFGTWGSRGEFEEVHPTPKD